MYGLAWRVFPASGGQPEAAFLLNVLENHYSLVINFFEIGSMFEFLKWTHTHTYTHTHTHIHTHTHKHIHTNTHAHTFSFIY